MKEYWKLLDLDNEKYTTHETEEEVNHIIDYLTRDMDEDKEITRKVIETPFNNYDFQSVLVVDCYKVRRFFYFFDTIEEECDSLSERIEEMNTHYETIFDPCIDTPLIRDLAYESQDMIHKIINGKNKRT